MLCVLLLVVLSLYCAESYVFGGFGLNLQRLKSASLWASRCGLHKDLYWNLRDQFSSLRDKTKRRPRELDYDCFVKWDRLKELPKEEMESLWLKSVDDLQTPATFRQFLLICDDLKIDKEFEEYLSENFVEREEEEDDED